MKSLGKIIEKYSKIQHNKDNYELGGGLTMYKFASNRHEDANNDLGKLTLGKAVQMFRKATGCELEFVKEILHYAVPNMEWHHAGKLPKAYGGGMKKTYFLNAQEIVMIATRWDDLVSQLEIAKGEKIREEIEQRNREKIKANFLKENAEKLVRVNEKPDFFYEVNREMNGKYGWFSSYGKSYNIPEYYTGWKFSSKERYNAFNKLCLDLT